MNIEHRMLVDDVMRRWPSTIRAFLDHRMGCPGCPIGCFHTLEDACLEHGADLTRFLGAVRAMADAEALQDV